MIATIILSNFCVKRGVENEKNVYSASVKEERVLIA